jgi:hypothetical protein
MAGPRDRRRWQLHFTPTLSSWLNIIEWWFKDLTDKRLPGEVFTNVSELIEAIRTWALKGTTTPRGTSGTPPPTRSLRKSGRGHAASTARPNQRRSMSALGV